MKNKVRIINYGAGAEVVSSSIISGSCNLFKCYKNYALIFIRTFIDTQHPEY